MVSSLFSLSCLLMVKKYSVKHIDHCFQSWPKPGHGNSDRPKQKVLDKRLVISPALSSKEVASKIDLMKNAELGETSPLDLSYMNQKIREKKGSISDKSQS